MRIMKFSQRDIRDGQTFYSEDLPGDRGNYEWTASVSVTAPGYVRIEQIDEAGTVKDVVLLTPTQWKRIVEFVATGQTRLLAGDKRQRAA